MSLLEKIQYHRATAREIPTYSPGWYYHYGKAAELVRKWRESNTLRSVDGQK